jgi:hypothetical protein
MDSLNSVSVTMFVYNLTIQQILETASLKNRYFVVHGFWPVEFSNGRPGASHLYSDCVMFGLVSSLRLHKYSSYE